MTDELQGQAPTTPDTDGQGPQGTTEASQLDADALAKELKAARKEAAAYRTKLRQAEEDAETRKRAEMTELERLKADLEAERQARTKAEEQRQRQIARTQVIAAAARLGFNDPEDAIRMLDQSTLEVDDAGNIDGLDDALSALVKSKPYLIKSTTGTISPTNPAGGPQRMSQEQMRQEMFGPKNTKLFDGGGVFWPQE
jgi:hypothetical protein